MCSNIHIGNSNANSRNDRLHSSTDKSVYSNNDHNDGNIVQYIYGIEVNG